MIYRNDSEAAILAMERDRTGNYGEDEGFCNETEPEEYEEYEEYEEDEEDEYY